MEQTSPSAREVVDTAVLAWIGGNDSAFWRLLADDVRYEVIGTTAVSGVYEGRRAFIASALAPMAALLSVAARPVEYDIVAEGQRVVLMWRGVGTMMNGEPYNNSYCWVLTITDSKISRIKAYLDTALVDALFAQ